MEFFEGVLHHCDRSSSSTILWSNANSSNSCHRYALTTKPLTHRDSCQSTNDLVRLPDETKLFYTNEVDVGFTVTRLTNKTLGEDSPQVLNTFWIRKSTAF